jgi:hypothetical protein
MASTFSGFPLSNGAPIVAGYEGTDDLGAFTVLVDRSNWPGASGSPIHLDNRRVIGIVLGRRIGDATGLTYGSVARLVRALLPAAQPEPTK